MGENNRFSDQENAPGEPVQLVGHPPQSRTTVQGRASLIFGLPFAGCGIYILLLASGRIEADPGTIHAPLWVIGVVGAAFLGGGIFFMIHGWLGLQRQNRVREGSRRTPGSPWLWDYPWDGRGFSDNRLWKTVNQFLVFIVFAVFLAPFNWWAFFSGKETYFLLYFIVGIFDLGILVLAGMFFYQLGQLIKYGNQRLVFNGFPFFLGDTVSVRLTRLPGNLDELTCRLRFIEEKYETHGSGRNRSQEVVCYRLYEDSQSFAGTELKARGTRGLDLKWDLPDKGEFRTRLSGRPARFWELELKGSAPGIDYEGRFLIPVYSRS